MPIFILWFNNIANVSAEIKRYVVNNLVWKRQSTQNSGKEFVPDLASEQLSGGEEGKVQELLIFLPES